jgi:hypothetical protein
MESALFLRTNGIDESSDVFDLTYSISVIV